MTTILQITDPHVMSRRDGTLKAVPTFQSFQTVMDKARDECAEPARVVLTGDLSHEHTASGYELVREVLGTWSERSLLIPGNHDDREAMRSVFRRIQGNADDDIMFHEQTENWQLIGLDSHVPGQVYGELSQAVLQQLRDWLEQEPERPTLIFVHHPPMSVHSAWIDQIILRNPDALAKVIERTPGVRGIFCGHIHQEYEGEFASVPVYTTPSAAFQFTPETDTMRFDFLPPGFRMIELNETEFSTHVVRLEKLRFAPQDE